MTTPGDPVVLEARLCTALRFGLGRYNVEAEVDEAVESLSRAVR